MGVMVLLLIITLPPPSSVCPESASIALGAFGRLLHSIKLCVASVAHHPGRRDSVPRTAARLTRCVPVCM